MIREDIAVVLARHTVSLMEMEGVVGVFQGERPNHDPIVVVLLSAQSEELRMRIPQKLDGYPVQIEVSGPIIPMCEGKSPNSVDS